MAATSTIPGWYDDGVTADQLRYWDGHAWTTHTSPVGAAPLATAAAQTRPCPYCLTTISSQAVRCSSCTGEMKFCARCKEIVGMTSRQKFVGMMRGGMKTQYRCMNCRLILDGPLF